MSRYIVLLGLLAVLGAVYGAGVEVTCKDNEKWALCGKLCEPSCLNPNPGPEWCPKGACSKFTADCRCDFGWVRNMASGLCVQVKDCPK